MPDKPTTVKGMVDQLWFATFGTNGNNGIVRRLESLETRPYRLAQTAHVFATLILLVLVFLFGTGVL